MSTPHALGECTGPAVAPSPLKRARRGFRHGFRLARSLLVHHRFPKAEATRAYTHYLEDKRIALVGPAPTVERSRQRDLIESHDVIVRLNHSFPVPEAMRDDVGVRTDVLYHNLNRNNPRVRPLAELVDLLENRVKWICSASPYVNMAHRHVLDIDAFADVLNDRVPFHVPATWPCLRLNRTLQTRPNAGVSTIADLLRFNIAQLYITGFTFYSGPRNYYEGYKGHGIGAHDQDRQRIYITQLLSRDPRVVLDDSLQDILFPRAASNPAPAPRGDTA